MWYATLTLKLYVHICQRIFFDYALTSFNNPPRAMSGISFIHHWPLHHMPIKKLKKK